MKSSNVVYQMFQGNRVKFMWCLPKRVGVPLQRGHHVMMYQVFMWHILAEATDHDWLQ